MSKTTERVDIYRCDKPGCKVVHYAERGPGAEKPDGLFGTVVRAYDGFVSASLSWFACTEEHAAAAIAEVLRAYRENLDAS